MSFNKGDDVLVTPIIDTGVVQATSTTVEGKYNVLSDRKKEHKDYFQGQLRKLPVEGEWVNERAFSYRATACVADGVRKLEVSDFAYRYDGVCHRGGRIKDSGQSKDKNDDTNQG
jgi:hypothetical protein